MLDDRSFGGLAKGAFWNEKVNRTLLNDLTTAEIETETKNEQL